MGGTACAWNLAMVDRKSTLKFGPVCLHTISSIDTDFYFYQKIKSSQLAKFTSKEIGSCEFLSYISLCWDCLWLFYSLSHWLLSKVTPEENHDKTSVVMCSNIRTIYHLCHQPNIPNSRRPPLQSSSRCRFNCFVLTISLSMHFHHNMCLSVSIVIVITANIAKHISNNYDLRRTWSFNLKRHVQRN